MYTTDNNQQLRTPDTSPEAVARERLYAPESSVWLIDQAINNMYGKDKTVLGATVLGITDPGLAPVDVYTEASQPNPTDMARAAVMQEYGDV